MSTNIDLMTITFAAQRAVNQFRIVDVSGDFAVTYASGLRSIGVSQRDVSSGQSVPVMVHGVTRVQAGGAITAGQFFTAQSGTGFAIAIASGAAGNTNVPVGRALTGAASGFLFSGFLNVPSAVASGVAV